VQTSDLAGQEVFHVHAHVLGAGAEQDEHQVPELERRFSSLEAPSEASPENQRGGGKDEAGGSG
jgi:diadenosine tetraphosphate (Ap4A) HIT family hydrolase